jgi:hypothetical protein
VWGWFPRCPAPLGCTIGGLRPLVTRWAKSGRLWHAWDEAAGCPLVGMSGGMKRAHRGRAGTRRCAFTSNQTAPAPHRGARPPVSLLGRQLAPQQLQQRVVRHVGEPGGQLAVPVRVHRACRGAAGWGRGGLCHREHCWRAAQYGAVRRSTARVPAAIPRPSAPSQLPRVPNAPSTTVPGSAGRPARRGGAGPASLRPGPQHPMRPHGPHQRPTGKGRRKAEPVPGFPTPPLGRRPHPRRRSAWAAARAAAPRAPAPRPLRRTGPASASAAPGRAPRRGRPAGAAGGRGRAHVGGWVGGVGGVMHGAARAGRGAPLWSAQLRPQRCAALRYARTSPRAHAHSTLREAATQIGRQPPVPYCPPPAAPRPGAGPRRRYPRARDPAPVRTKCVFGATQPATAAPPPRRAAPRAQRRPRASPHAPGPTSPDRRPQGAGARCDARAAGARRSPRGGGAAGRAAAAGAHSGLGRRSCWPARAKATVAKRVGTRHGRLFV